MMEARGPRDGVVAVPVSVVPATDQRMSLGEGPTWDAQAGLARWVDITSGRLFEARIDGRTLGTPRIALTVDGTLGAAVHAEGGGLLLATSRHLEHRDADGALVGRVEVVPEGMPSRLNDGACDPSGRYLVGSVALDSKPGREMLWRLEHDGTLTVIDDDLLLSNGIAWSPKGDLMYHVDTFRNTVLRRTYDSATGAVGGREAFIETPGEYPDGLTVGADGDLWVAYWNSGEVRRYSAGGALLATIAVGAPLTTSCAFVGPDLDLLLITTEASAPGVEPTARSGALLACTPGARGLPTREWRPAPMG
jgi:sugar lactone lactonase YvrE